MVTGRTRIVAPKERDLSKRTLLPRRSRKLRVASIVVVAALSVAASTLIVLKIGTAFLSGEREALGRAVQSASNVKSCFTPSEFCAAEIVEKIRNSNSEIRVQAYGFTSELIALALVQARKRGIDVAVILDKSAESSLLSRHSDADLVARAGIPVYIDFRPSIAHNKVMIIDRHLVITGSYNFTASAERRNAENVIFIDASEVAARFLANWNSRKEVSRAYEPSDSGARP
jgi:phospholipase D